MKGRAVHVDGAGVTARPAALRLARTGRSGPAASPGPGPREEPSNLRATWIAACSKFPQESNHAFITGGERSAWIGVRCGWRTCGSVLNFVGGGRWSDGS